MFFLQGVCVIIMSNRKKSQPSSSTSKSKSRTIKGESDFVALDLNGIPGKYLYLPGIMQRLQEDAEKVQNALSPICKLNYLSKSRLGSIERSLSRMLNLNVDRIPKLQECTEALNMVRGIRENPTEDETKGIQLMSHLLKLQDESRVLDVFVVLINGTLCDVHLLAKNGPEYIDSCMERLNLIFKHRFRDRICRSFAILEHGMNTMCGLDRKYLKQVNYSMYVAEMCLEDVKATERTTDEYKDSMRYLMFGRTLYIGKLLEYSKLIHFSKGSSADSLAAAFETLNLDEKFVKLETVELKRRDYMLPDCLLTKKQEVKAIFAELLNYQTKLHQFRPLTVKGDLTSYDIMTRVIQYALKMFPFLNKSTE